MSVVAFKNLCFVTRAELNARGLCGTPVGENGRYGVLLDGKVMPLNLRPACLAGITRVEPLPALLGCAWTPGTPGFWIGCVGYGEH